MRSPAFSAAPTAAAPPRPFAPATAGANAVPNRVVIAPMTRTRAGVPGPAGTGYSRQRASAGLIVTEYTYTECTYVAPLGRGILRSPGLVNADQVEGCRGSPARGPR